MGYDAFTPNTVKTRLSLPLNGTIFTTTRMVSSEKPLPAVGETMENELGGAYATSRIIAVTDGPDRSKGILTITHAIIPTEEEQLASNWEHMDLQVGIGQFRAVTRSVIMLESDYNETSPAINTALPVIATKLFDGSHYVLYSRECVKSGTALEPVFRVEKRTYVLRVPFVSHDFDEQLGGDLKTTQTLLHSSEEFPEYGIASTGYETEGKQVTPEWHVITKRQMIPSAFLASGRTYYTSEHYSWPPVLSSIALDNWPRKDGGSDVFVRPEWSRNAFQGECKAQVIETWSLIYPTVSIPTQMLPLPIMMSCPFFMIRIEASLHTTQTVTIASGTAHPTYNYAGSIISFTATTLTDWPSSVIAQDEVVPFRGGYMRKQITIYRP